MATSQQSLVCDSSTLANFKNWAQAISTFFGTAGWLQSTDTGQVNWTSIASAPGNNAFVYEVWKPNDGLTNFFLKIEYGNNGGTNNPCIRLTLSTTTDGAGNATGSIVGPYMTAQQGITSPGTASYECDLSGAAGRISAMMWRPITQQQIFAVERSVNGSGAYTGTYVTLWVFGSASSSKYGGQQTLMLSPAGVAPGSTPGGNPNGWMIRCNNFNGAGTSGDLTYGGTIPFDTAAPIIGYFDYPCTVVGAVYGADVSEGLTFQATLYGSLRTYIPTKVLSSGNWGGGSMAICMRYD